MALVVAACLCLVSSTLPVEPDRSVVVWPEEPCADGWVVHWTLGGIPTASIHGDPEAARRLYAVLARVMVGGGER